METKEEQELEAQEFDESVDKVLEEFRKIPFEVRLENYFKNRKKYE